MSGPSNTRPEGFNGERNFGNCVLLLGHEHKTKVRQTSFLLCLDVKNLFIYFSIVFQGHHCAQKHQRDPSSTVGIVFSNSDAQGSLTVSPLQPQDTGFLFLINRQ